MPHEGVACEHCGVQRVCNYNQSVDALRNELRKVGWLCVSEIDVCPACRGAA